MAEQPPRLPTDQLHDALEGDHAAHAEIDALHAELGRDQPSTDEIHARVERLRGLPQVTSILANWWDDPRTQLFIHELTIAGL